MPAKSRVKYRVATLDIETDPFLYGRVPHPFTIGFFDGEDYVDFWGDDCIAEMIDYLDQYPEPLRIFVHNGGGFDFWYLQDWMTNPVFFINKRVAKCGFLGKHELRDSYRMIPIALKKFAKEDIDYAKLEESVREKNKREILYYQMMDCKHLYTLVTEFIERHGDHLTIGSAALKHLKKLHPNKSVNPYFDELFRPYYMGGRNQFFKTGKVTGDFKIYDVNSLYPYTMHSTDHPGSANYKIRSKLPDNNSVYFATIVAESKGALPIRTKTGLDFPHGEFQFNACSHEINAALELGLLKIKRVISCREFETTQRFDTYVDEFSKRKIEAEQAGDKAGREFSKLFLNSSYGKFGQDPSKYRDCEIVDSLEDAEEGGYTLTRTFGDRFIAEKPVEIKPWSFNNVSIAASITSSARAVLLRGIHNAQTPVYVDTDSIICESLDAELHATKLGAWKNEGECDTVYIAGKKLYVAYKDGEVVKKASKGVQLDAETIRYVAETGETVPVPIDAPVLRLASDAKFIRRNIRSTY